MPIEIAALGQPDHAAHKVFNGYTEFYKYFIAQCTSEDVHCWLP